MKLVRETHKDLRGGTGEVRTYTLTFKIPFTEYQSGKFIILRLAPEASIGMHTHTVDSEIYIALSKGIRFNNDHKWSLVNQCKRGMSHGARNIACKDSYIFAYKN